MSKRKEGHFIHLGEELQNLRDEISRLLQKWSPICNLQDWELESLFQADADEVCPDASACVTVQYGYKTAVFRWRLPRLLARTPKDGLEYVVVHEICHVLVNGMRGAMKWDDTDMLHEERTVTELAKCFLRAQRKSREV
jgi:hypothetical protein